MEGVPRVGGRPLLMRGSPHDGGTLTGSVDGPALLRAGPGRTNRSPPRQAPTATMVIMHVQLGKTGDRPLELIGSK